MIDKEKVNKEIAECKRELADLRTALYIGSKYGASSTVLEDEIRKLERRVRKLTREVNYE